MYLAVKCMSASDVAVVGFHGQTVLHQADRHLTVQLGNGATLAHRLGIPVVYDFRAADVAAGGEGAPLVPVYHRAMVRMFDGPQPVGVLNLGGVANVTFIDGDELVAFDVGPGNALIDDFIRLRTGEPQDADGLHAAAGKVDEESVAHVLAHPYFARRPPKSLDRNEFRHWVAERGWPCQEERSRRRRDAHGDQRCGDCGCARAAAAFAGKLDRRWRRNAQCDLDADARRAAGAGPDRDCQ